jgi:hypothetical protein
MMSVPFGAPRKNVRPRRNLEILAVTGNRIEAIEAAGGSVLPAGAEDRWLICGCTWIKLNIYQCPNCVFGY